MDTDCACIYDSGDGELPTFSTEKFVVARKPHKCCECDETISVGTQYHRMSGKWDDAVQTKKTCLLCHEIRHTFCCDGWTYGALWEDIEEQMFHERGLDSACLDQLVTVDAKQFLQKRWWEWVERQQ